MGICRGITIRQCDKNNVIPIIAETVMGEKRAAPPLNREVRLFEIAIYMRIISVAKVYGTTLFRLKVCSRFSPS